MVVVHIVLLKIKSNLSASEVNDFKDGTHKLAAVKELKPFYKEFQWGPPVFDARAKGYDWGLYSVFHDKESLQKYNTHQEHVDCVQNIIRPCTEDLLAYDFEI